MQTTFADLGLSSKVLEAVTAAGYTTPTPIQAAAIPVANEGRDVLGIAQTGTGKTASFVLPMLTRLERGRARARMPRSLILAPTRELAAQVEEHFNRFGTQHKLTVALLIGGVSFDEQNKKLDRGADVLIATPGRLLDQFQRGKILMTGVEILVIDEADRMLDMGFIPDIERICGLLPPSRQTLFFSATMPPEITRLVERFLKDPQRVEVARQATTASTITQRFCKSPSDPKAKRSVLRNLIRSQPVKNAIIFCNRKRDVAILHKSLASHGFNAGALHGDMDQSARTATLDGFRSGQISLLAASDVAARGLDIPDVSHVFNYDVPIHAEDYVHRIGRTGRAGREGFAGTLVTPEDSKQMRIIEKLIGKAPEWLEGIEPEPGALDGERSGGRRERSGRGRDRDGGRGRDRDGGRESSRDGQRRGRGRHEGSGDRPERAATEEAEITTLGGGDAGGFGEDAGSPRRREREPSRDPSEGAMRDEGRRRSGRPPREEHRGDQARSEHNRGEPRGRSEGPRRERGGEERSAPRDRDRGRPAASPREGAPRDQGRDRRFDRPDRSDRRHARRDDAPVLGLGDHVPDFLKRPVKIGG